MAVYSGFKELQDETNYENGQEAIVDRKIQQFRYIFVADSIKGPRGHQIIRPLNIAEDQPGRWELQLRLV